MKTKNLIVTFALAAMALNAWAAPDRSYYVTELQTPQKFDVYNDGRNTYLESIPGLVVTGATADGELYIVKGVPSQIKGFMNGKPITVLRGTAPMPEPKAKPNVQADPVMVRAELKRLTDELTKLSATSSATVAPSAASASAAASAGSMAGQSAHVKAPPSRPTVNDQIVWRVSPHDGNLRLLISRWAHEIGWSTIWDVDRDFPIGTTDEKSNDFKSAIRRVLAATEFADIQLKPCFYSNQVLRVVRKTTKCNPTE